MTLIDRAGGQAILLGTAAGDVVHRAHLSIGLEVMQDRPSAHGEDTALTSERHL